jgi:hypothetical protein
MYLKKVRAQKNSLTLKKQFLILTERKQFNQALGPTRINFMMMFLNYLKIKLMTLKFLKNLNLFLEIQHPTTKN